MGGGGWLRAVFKCACQTRDAFVSVLSSYSLTIRIGGCHRQSSNALPSIRLENAQRTAVKRDWSLVTHCHIMLNQTHIYKSKTAILVNDTKSQTNDTILLHKLCVNECNKYGMVCLPENWLGVCLVH